MTAHLGTDTSKCENVYTITNERIPGNVVIQTSKMSSFRFDTQFFAVLGLICLIYFVWMDVGLYYNLNSARGNLLVTQNYEKLK
jgi:hypothetical protein